MTRATPETVTAWAQVVLAALRDVAALVVGVWILLFRQTSSATQLTLAFLLLTLGASGAGKAVLRGKMGTKP